MFKIGFTAGSNSAPQEEERVHCVHETFAPRKSVVRIRFSARNMTLSYYNDRFDLHPGDIVYVDGKLEGLRGRVVEVTYNFKIKLSDYQRVIAVADTRICGELHLAGSHFLSFLPDVLPFQQAVTWFYAPGNNEEYASGYDESAFRLDNLAAMKIDSAVADRGHVYYMENKVCYLCLNGSQGRAIVEGSRPYEVEFEYNNGEISNLTCSCFCAYPCKHEFATMLQLRETLGIIEKNYGARYERSKYFAAVSKDVFMSFAMDGAEAGSFTITRGI